MVNIKLTDEQFTILKDILKEGLTSQSDSGFVSCNFCSGFGYTPDPKVNHKSCKAIALIELITNERA